jgi:hypothetical protein
VIGVIVVWIVQRVGMSIVVRVLAMAGVCHARRGHAVTTASEDAVHEDMQTGDDGDPAIHRDAQCGDGSRIEREFSARCLIKSTATCISQANTQRANHRLVAIAFFSRRISSGCWR